MDDVKIEECDLEIDDTIWKCLKQEVVDMDSVRDSNVDNTQPTSMFITFKTEDHARSVYKCLNSGKEEITVEDLSKSIVNFALDKKLQMKPIVRLENLGSKFLNMSSEKRKNTKDYPPKQTFKVPRTRNQIQSNTIVSVINFPTITNLEVEKKTSCEKPNDIVPYVQVKGQSNHLNLSKCNLYPNGCNRTTSRTWENRETLKLMKKDFEILWTIENEISRQDIDEDNNLFPEVINNTDSRFRTRSTRKLSETSTASSVESNSNMPDILLSPGVKLGKKLLCTKQPKENSTVLKVPDSENPKEVPSKSKISPRRKTTSRKRKLETSTQNNNFTIPTQNDIKVSTETSLATNEKVENPLEICESEKKAQTVLPNRKSRSFGRSEEIPDDMGKSRHNNQVPDYNSESDWKNLSSSESTSVLSTSKLFGRRSSSSTIMSSASATSKTKIKLQRTCFGSTKSLRKRRNTKSNILEDILPRVTSNDTIFNNRPVLDNNELDLEQSSMKVDEKSANEVPVHTESCKNANEFSKSEVLVPKETVRRKIVDLRDIISPKASVSNYNSYFEVKRPPWRPHASQQLTNNDRQKKMTTMSSFSSVSSSTNSSFSESSFPPRNFENEDDVISLFAESVIVNTSPLSDRGLDEENSSDDHSETFTKYGINERTLNSSETNACTSISNIPSTNLIENSLSTNDDATNGTTQKLDNNKQNSLQDYSERRTSIDVVNASVHSASLVQNETVSSFVSPPQMFSPIETQSNFNSLLGRLFDNSVTNNRKNSVSPGNSAFLCDKSNSKLSSNSVTSPGRFSQFDITNNSSSHNDTSDSGQTEETIQNSLANIDEAPSKDLLRSIGSVAIQTRSGGSTPNSHNSIKSPRIIDSPASIKSPKDAITNEDLCDEFRAFFRNVCFHYLEYGFCGTEHSLRHQIPPNYEDVLESLTSTQISETYNNFVCSYSFLLEKTIPTFAKYFGKYEDENNLFDMVQKLQKLKVTKPKVKMECMSTILDALCDSMQFSVAIEKIYQHIATKDINMIDILLELLLKEPSFENNWSLIKKLTSVEDYEIPLKVVEFILNDCCNRSKVRKYHLQNVYYDVIMKIADVNLLKIRGAYMDDFVRLMEKMGLNQVDELKTRLKNCNSRMNTTPNDIVFKVPNVPSLVQSISSSSFLTTTINPNLTKVTPINNGPDVPENDRYNPTTSKNIINHQPFVPKLNRARRRNDFKANKRQFIIKKICNALNKGDLNMAIRELQRCSKRSDFEIIFGKSVNNMPTEKVDFLRQRVLNNGFRYAGNNMPEQLF